MSVKLKDVDEIYNGICKNIQNGKYDMDPIYGDGFAGEKIAEILSTCNWDIQKVISY